MSLPPRGLGRATSHTLLPCLALALGCWARSARAECGDAFFDFEQEDEGCDDGNRIDGDGCDKECEVECAEIGALATEHTCLHGAFGPFVSVSAQAYVGAGSFIFSDISAPHTYFTVRLNGTPGANESAVLYYPNATGEFAIYMREPFALQVLDEEGQEQPVLLEHAISSCPVAESLTWVRVYRLSDTVQYRMVFGASAMDDHALAVEYLPSFSRPWYRDNDGDGQGGPVLVAQSWCRAPSGFVETEYDCDDGDPNNWVYNEEVCDGRDNDCDGVGDNGLRCDAAAASSSASSSAASAPSSSSDVPSPAAASSSAGSFGPIDGGAGPDGAGGRDAEAFFPSPADAGEPGDGGAPIGTRDVGSETGPNPVDATTGAPGRPITTDAGRASDGGKFSGEPRSASGCDCRVSGGSVRGESLAKFVGPAWLLVSLLRRRSVATQRRVRAPLRTRSVLQQGCM